MATLAAPTAGGTTPASNKNIIKGIVPTPAATLMCDDWIETKHSTSVYLPPVYRQCLVRLIHGFGDRRELAREVDRGWTEVGVPLGPNTTPVAWALTMVKRLLVMWRDVEYVMPIMHCRTQPRPQASLVMKPDFMLELGLVRRYFQGSPLPLEERIAKARAACVAQSWVDIFQLLFIHEDVDFWIHAASAHSPQILRLLLEHHYNVGAMNGGGPDEGKAEVRRRVNEALGFDGTTPLMHAAWGGSADCTQMLLEGGANVEALDSQGHTARISVTGLLCKEEALEVLRILYDHSPKETMDFLVTKNAGTAHTLNSTFAVACEHQSTPDLLKWLLALFEPIQLGWDAAMEGAILNRNGTKVLEALLERDEPTVSCLDLDEIVSKPQVTTMLYQRFGWDLVEHAIALWDDYDDDYYQMYLDKLVHWAAKNGHHDVVEALLEHSTANSDCERVQRLMASGMLH